MGKKEWIEPSSIQELKLDPDPDPDPSVPPPTNFKILISVLLAADKPAVTFYDGEKLGEDLKVDDPLVKIELHECLTMEHDQPTTDDNCCLLKPFGDKMQLSPYHFFRNVRVKSTSTIDVEVCGLKNIVVQNDENVQDVNSLIYPFGVRPTVDGIPCNINEPYPDFKGSSFFIGSKEALCKNWNNIWIKLNWKDKPSDFTNYYNGFQEPSNGIVDIKQDDFKYLLGILQDQNWKVELPQNQGQNPHLQSVERYRKLFDTYGSSNCTFSTGPFEQTIELNSQFFDLNDEFENLKSTGCWFRC